MEFKMLLLLSTISMSPSFCLLPPKFQWKVIDFAWEGQAREAALATGAYIPENNLPTGLARWKEKLFITIPRWKKGIPASLNYVYINGSQSQPLRPYPSWSEAFISSKACCVSANSTVVSTFRVHVDKCNRLWVVDNGVADMVDDLKQIAPPSVLIFDLKRDVLAHRYELPDEVLRDSSVFTSVVVEIGKGCADAFAYIPDMGSNAILVYSLKANDAWRLENHYFHFDPHAGVYNVGGIEFYWSDGVSAVTLSAEKISGYRDLYFHPTSSTKQFRMSTKLLKNRNVPKEDIFNGVQVLGDRGPSSQATACDFDHRYNVMFYTQLSKNGVSCWNTQRPLIEENVPLIISDCTVLEFPNDIKVDSEGIVWILSDRQSRFLYDTMDFKQINFRVLAAPVAALVQGTPCDRLSVIDKALSFMKRSSHKEL